MYDTGQLGFFIPSLRPSLPHRQKGTHCIRFFCTFKVRGIRWLSFLEASIPSHGANVECLNWADEFVHTSFCQAITIDSHFHAIQLIFPLFHFTSLPLPPFGPSVLNGQRRIPLWVVCKHEKHKTNSLARLLHCSLAWQDIFPLFSCWEQSVLYGLNSQLTLPFYQNSSCVRKCILDIQFVGWASISFSFPPHTVWASLFGFHQIKRTIAFYPQLDFKRLHKLADITWESWRFSVLRHWGTVLHVCDDDDDDPPNGYLKAETCS